MEWILRILSDSQQAASLRNTQGVLNASSLALLSCRLSKILLCMEKAWTFLSAGLHTDVSDVAADALHVCPRTLALGVAIEQIADERK